MLAGQPVGGNKGKGSTSKHLSCCGSLLFAVVLCVGGSHQQQTKSDGVVSAMDE